VFNPHGNYNKRCQSDLEVELISLLLLIRVPPGPYKSLKVLKFHTFKYKALKSP